MLTPNNYRFVGSHNFFGGHWNWTQGLPVLRWLFPPVPLGVKLVCLWRHPPNTLRRSLYDRGTLPCEGKSWSLWTKRVKTKVHVSSWESWADQPLDHHHLYQLFLPDKSRARLGLDRERASEDQEGEAETGVGQGKVPRKRSQVCFYEIFSSLPLLDAYLDKLWL